MQIVPLRFCHIGTKRAFCGLQNTPKFVFGWGSAPNPAWGAPPDALVGWGGDTPPIPHITWYRPTFSARPASPIIPARFTPMNKQCRQVKYRHLSYWKLSYQINLRSEVGDRQISYEIIRMYLEGQIVEYTDKEKSDADNDLASGTLWS